MKTKTYKPVGFCIYCGSTENLTREHIVSRGLGGNLILPKASCRSSKNKPESCSTITSRFEARLQRGQWWPKRRVLNLPSYDPSGQPNQFAISVESGREKKEMKISPEEYPGLILFKFDPPSILLGKESHGEPIAREMFYHFESDAAMRRAQRSEGLLIPGETKITLKVNLKVDDFVRLLAKIAHAYAIAELGYDSFEQFYLPKIIRGEVNGANTFVGSASSLFLPSVLADPEGLHGLMIRVQGQFRSVYIQLFRDRINPPPIYEVIVGKVREREPSQITDGALRGNGMAEVNGWEPDRP